MSEKILVAATLILLHVLSLERSPTKPLLYSDEYPTMPDVYQRKEWEAFQNSREKGYLIQLFDLFPFPLV